MKEEIKSPYENCYQMNKAMFIRLYKRDGLRLEKNSWRDRYCYIRACMDCDENWQSICFSRLDSIHNRIFSNLLWMAWGYKGNFFDSFERKIMFLQEKLGEKL